MLSPSYVSLVESGRRQPAAAALAHIAERLGVDVEFLRDGVDASVRARARLALARAQMMMQHGEVKEAYDKLTELIGDPGLNDEQQREVLLGRARALELIGDLNGALDILTELAEQARRAPAAYPWLDVAIVIARCYREVGDFAMAIQIGEEALRSAAELELMHTDEYVRLANTIVNAYYARGDITHATRLAKEIVELSDEIGTPHTRGGAYWNAAVIAQGKEQYAQALQLMDKARAMFGESDDNRNQARIKNAYAELLLHTPAGDNAQKALDIITATRADMELHGTTTELGILETSHARALMQLGRLDEARDAINEALTRISPDSQLRRAGAQLVLADIYRHQGDIEASLREGRDAAATLHDLGTTHHAAAAWRTLGDLYRQLDRHDQAMTAYINALESVGIRQPTQTPNDTTHNPATTH